MGPREKAATKSFGKSRQRAEWARGFLREWFLGQVTVTQAPMREGTVLVGEAAGQAGPGQESRQVCVAGSVVGKSKEGRSQFTQGSQGPICRGAETGQGWFWHPHSIAPTSIAPPLHLTQKLGSLSSFSQLTFRGQDSVLRVLPLSSAASSMETPEPAKGTSETCESWTVPLFPQVPASGYFLGRDPGICPGCPGMT